MNVEHPLVPVEGNDPYRRVPGAAVAASEAAEVTPLDRVVALMRGRWAWAIILGAVLGGVGGAGGYLVMEPVYESQGMIHIQPILPRGLDLDDHVLPMYTNYVNHQAAVLGDQTNVERALDRPEWQPLRQQGREVPTVADFMRHLAVDHPRHSEHIVVRYDHADPQVAQMAVRTIIAAYEQHHEGTRQQDERLAVFEQRRTRLRADLRSLRDERGRLAREYGTADLGPHYRAKLEEAQKLRGRLNEVEIALLVATGGRDMNGLAQADALAADVENLADDVLGELDVQAVDGEPAPAEQAELTVEDIAAVDREMQQYVAQRREMARELRRLDLSLGSNHREVRQARTTLESIEETIEEHAEAFRRRYGDRPLAEGEVDGASLDELRRQRRLLAEAYERVHAEAIALGRRNMEIQGLRDEEEMTAEDLRRADQRIAGIQAETNVGGRIQVRRPLATQPVEPVRDRRKLASAAGVTFGGASGFALILALAFFDRRFRSIHDASDTLGRVAMLGILPRLPDDLADPDQASIASHCVHQIRTLLQIGPESHGRRVFSLTSPGPGDGKTSLTLALGLSFTTAGAKTLLIDFDLGAGGLTERIAAIIRRKIGQVLQRQDLVTEQQVEQAVRVAQESNRRLGEVLVELGYVTAEDLEEALSLQEQTPVGLLDALSGEPLENCVADTGIGGLSILPIGSASPDDVARLSPLTIRRLLDEARQQFDIILVDTGPVPASLDASHVAVESDGVVMVVSRGEQRTQAERSLDYLSSIDARVAGVVFNRAENSDLDAMGETSGDDSLGRRRSGHFAVRPDGAHTRFGPVARAVAGTAAATPEKNGRHPEASNGNAAEAQAPPQETDEPS